MEYPGTATYIVTIYPFRFYEQELRSASSAYTTTRYYMLNGQAIALRTGNEAVTYLHRDQVGSVVMTTQNGAFVDSRQYFPYGSKRGVNEYPFAQNYRGQPLDDTVLLYCTASSRCDRHSLW